jgi:hypothetical protein
MSGSRMMNELRKPFSPGQNFVSTQYCFSLLSPFMVAMIKVEVVLDQFLIAFIQS